MDMTCRCKGSYTCVACKVKRGDYRDWMGSLNPARLRQRPKCRAVNCERVAQVTGLCWMHYEIGALHRRDRVWIVAHSPELQLRHVAPARHDGARRASEGSLSGQGAVLADTEGQRVALRSAAPERSRGPASGGLMADTVTSGRPGRSSEPRREPEGRTAAGRPGWWAIEPDVGRVANGVPGRMDRLSALGNAVVPQAAELIGRHLMAVLNG